jgi:lysophospholipase L1-like esterase
MTLGSRSVVSATTNPVTGGIRISAPTGFSKIVAVLGDSIVANNNSNVSENSSQGFWSWANLLMGKRFSYSPSMNFGVSGNKTSDVLLRMQPVLTSGADICIVLIGTNDIGGGSTASIAYANLLSIWTQLRSAGMLVVACTIMPRSDVAMTASRIKELMQLNALIRLNVPKYSNMILWDTYSDLADPASLTAAPVTSYFLDLLHPNKLGAFWAGKSLAKVINAAIPGPVVSEYQCVTGSDLYDATSTPNGNKLTNAMLSGTGGTNSGAYATGSVATGWTVNRELGATITCVSSKGTVTLDNGQTYATQILTVSSPGAGVDKETIEFYQTGTGATGDFVLLGADIAVSAVSGRLNYVTPRVQAFYGAFPVLGYDVWKFEGGANSIPAFSGHTCSVPGVAVPSPGGNIRASFLVNLDCTVASSVQVVIALPYLRKT